MLSANVPFRPATDLGVMLSQICEQCRPKDRLNVPDPILDDINPDSSTGATEMVARLGLIRLCLTPAGLTCGQSVSLRSARTYDPAAAGL
jgi:hypothetical protein